MKQINGKKVCITGSARRIGKQLAIAAAKAGASIILHFAHSKDEVMATAKEIRGMGAEVEVIHASFLNPQEAADTFKVIFNQADDLYALVNNASIFQPLKFKNTTLTDWQTHLDVNLTVPFLLSQTFQESLGNRKGKIINILDWRALRPGRDHFPYTISKAGLAALTKTMALTMAPNISVNGIALGAILPPSDGNKDNSSIIDPVPMARWGELEELKDLFLFLLTAPDYITGEIIHLDGGRHLV
jgi:NAD(P)-dependent dehydrogenase (short-subunit alcohol dehydrogenase family)